MTGRVGIFLQSIKYWKPEHEHMESETWVLSHSIWMYSCVLDDAIVSVYCPEVKFLQKCPHLSHQQGQSSDGFVQRPDLRRRPNHQRCPRVHDCLATAFTQGSAGFPPPRCRMTWQKCARYYDCDEQIIDSICQPGHHVTLIVIYLAVVTPHGHTRFQCP